MSFKFGADFSRFMVQKEPKNILKYAFYLIVPEKCEKNAAGVTEEVQLSRLRNSRAPFTVQLTLVKLFLGPRLFWDCFILQGFQFHGFQSLKGK